MKTQNKLPITKKEVIIRLVIVGIVLTVSYMTGHEHRRIINVLALLISFFCTLYLHRHFFPLFTMVVLCYLTASVQDLWNPQYSYLEITQYLWTAGNWLMPVAIVDFIYQLMFKYKIVENGQKD